MFPSHFIQQQDFEIIVARYLGSYLALMLFSLPIFMSSKSSNRGKIE